MEGNLESFPGTKAVVFCLSKVSQRPDLVLCVFFIDLCPSCSKPSSFMLHVHLLDMIMLSHIDHF